MHRISGIVSGCGLLLTTSGCSLLTKWPDVNDNTKGGGGAGGEDAGGSSSKAGNASKGGASNLGGTSNLGESSNGGASNVGGASNSGGQSNLGGSANGGTSSSAGTASNLGGSGNELGGASGLGGASSGGASNGGQGGTSAGGGGTGGNAGTGATTTLAIATSTLPTAKTGVAYNATVTASGASSYSWSIASGTLPSGVALQSTSSATLTIAGTPKEAGLFPLKLSVTDGTTTKTIDLSLAVTHRVAFLSDRITSGVKELFLTEVGTETAASPVRLSAPLTSGGVTSFAWSPDGTRVAYLRNDGYLMVVTISSGVDEPVSPSGGVISFTWLTGGRFVGYNSVSAIAVADVTSSPVLRQVVTMPPLPTSHTRQFHSMVASPRENEYAFNYVEASNSPTFFTRLATWHDGSGFASIPLRNNRSNHPTLSFCSDGTLLSTSAQDGGLNVHDVSSALLPPTTYQVDGPNSARTWSTTSRRLLSNSSLGATLNLHEFGATAIASTALTSPVCPPKPGPWSPSGQHALFTCDTDLRGMAQVSSLSTDTDFSLFPARFSATQLSSPGWSSDSKWVAVLADRGSSGVIDLYLLRWSSPGIAYKPYAIGAIPGVSGWQFAPNSLSVAFVGRLGSAQTTGLHLSTLPETGAPTTATPLTSASSPAVQNDITWLPGARVVLYRANDVGGPQLHAVHVTRSGSSSTPVTVSGAGGTGVPSYAAAPLP